MSDTAAAVQRTDAARLLLQGVYPLPGKAGEKIRDSCVTIDRTEMHTVWVTGEKWVCFVPREVRKIKSTLPHSNLKKSAES